MSGRPITGGRSGQGYLHVVEGLVVLLLRNASFVGSSACKKRAGVAPLRAM